MSALSTAYRIPGLQISAAHLTSEGLVISAQTGAHWAACPQCGQTSRRLHGHYWRHPSDLPCGLQGTRPSIQVTRFRCLNAACPAQTFSASSADILRFARRTARLQTFVAHLGFGLGAERAAEFCRKAHIVVSPDAILRVMKTQPSPAPWTPRVLGVDDWAIRKGQSYGTVLVDLERHQVIDVLKDRSTMVLRDWLKAHPGIEIVTRDRASEYSRAVTEAAPQALQVADRWHLLCNLSGVVREWILRERTHWKEVISAVKPKVPPESKKRQTGEGRLRIPIKSVPFTDLIRPAGEGKSTGSAVWRNIRCCSGCYGIERNP